MPVKLKDAITQEQLKRFMVYDPETGIFTRNIRRGPFGKGTVAGTKLNTGYISIRIAGIYFQAHRLAWLYMTGKWPDGWIDHINHNKSDNRFVNLRDVSWSDNMHNLQSAKKQSVSKSLGVSPRKDKWIAQIQRHGKKEYLGIYDTKEEARAAYLARKKQLLDQ